MMKLCWARQIEVIAHALIKELSKDEPDLTTVASLTRDIQDQTVFIEDQLKNEGVILVR
jgi:hypothetical protein